jgi:D-lactate dehydrogenase (cytochrome)
MSVSFHTNIETDHPDCLRDESRLVGRAESVAFPESEADIIDALAKASAEHIPVTLQGARTGITGGAVPQGGCALSLNKMNQVSSIAPGTGEAQASLTIQPGVILADMRAVIKQEKNNGKWFYPPDPTETSAALGGMVACNASGARSFGYGPTRGYVKRLRIVLANGSVVELQRGQQKADGRSFSIECSNGNIISGQLPTYNMPPVKNAAGYYAADNMDLIDLFIGSEGTLGVFSEIELRLARCPEAQCGVTVFLPSLKNALRFVELVRRLPNTPVAIEFFDNNSLELLQSQKDDNPAFKELPDIPENFHDAIFLEYHAANEDLIGEALTGMSEAISECGGSEEHTWIADNPKEMERLKTFRHAVPEAVNLFIDERRKSDPELTKLGTDMAVPADRLGEIVDTYTSTLDASGLHYIMFGHIGDNHIHVNILPDNMEQYEQGKLLYSKWAETVVQMGGTVSAEHGIGKLKVALLQEMYGADGIRQMKTVKELFDPDNILNRGNLFGP